MKARVYVETTIISYLVGWLNQHDLYVSAQQEFTRDWWTNQRHTKVYAICRSAGYEPPFVCTPFELKEGQQ